MIPLVVCMGNVSEYLPLTESMRDFQARYSKVAEIHDWETSHVEWPDCSWGTEAPAFPSHEFYQNDLRNPERAAQLVREFRDVFFSSVGNDGMGALYEHFVNIDSGVWDGTEGFEELEGFHQDSMPYVPDHEITTATDEETGLPKYAGALAVMRSYLDEMRVVALEARQVDREIKMVGQTAEYIDGYSQDLLEVCTASMSAAAASWELRDWRSIEDSVVPSFTLNSIHVSEMVFFDSQTQWGVHWDQFRSHFSRIKGKIEVDLSAIEGDVALFLKVVGPYTMFRSTSSYYFTPGTPHDPPVEPYDQFNLWTEVSGEGKGLWRSDEVNPGDEISFTVPCSTTATAGSYAGWRVEDQVALVKPDFAARIDDQECECRDCPGCPPGGTEATTSESLSFEIDLGLDGYGNRFGYLKLHADVPFPELASPQGLEWWTGDEASVVEKEGTLRRIDAPQAKVTVAPSGSDPDGHYMIDFAHPDGHPKAGEVFRRFEIRNPDTTEGEHDRLEIVEKNGGDTFVRGWKFLWEEEQSTWRMAEGYDPEDSTAVRWESTRKEFNEEETEKAETYEVRDQEGNLVFREERLLQLMPWGDYEVVREIEGAGEDSLTTHYDYYEEPDPDGNGYGEVRSIEHPNGYEELFQYDSLGRVVATRSPSRYGGQPEGEGIRRVAYEEHDDGLQVVAEIEKIDGREVARTYRTERIVAPDDQERTFRKSAVIRAEEPGVPMANPGNQRITTWRHRGGEWAGEPARVEMPDGTVEIATYSRDPDSGERTRVIERGVAGGDGDSIVDGIRETSVDDRFGNPLERRKEDIAGGAVLSWEVATEWDPFGRPEEIVYQDGTTSLHRYGCCELREETDRKGVTTVYDRDALGRITGTTRDGIRMDHELDPEGRILETFRTGTDGSDRIRIEHNRYDTAGRLKWSSDAVGKAIEYDYREGGRVRETVYADGSSRKEGFLPDGARQEVTGDAVYPVRHEYGVEAPPGMTEAFRFRKEIRLVEDDGGGWITDEWTKTYFDAMNRPVLKLWPASDEEVRFGVHEFEYDVRGLLVREYRGPHGESVPGEGIQKLYEYDAGGDRRVTAIDVGLSGGIDWKGEDRIVEAVHDYLPQGHDGNPESHPVERMRTYVWDDGDDGQRRLDRTDYRTVEGILDGKAVRIDQRGLTVHSETTFDGGGRSTEIVTEADGTYETRSFDADRIVAEAEYDADGNRMTGREYQYDRHRRVQAAIDDRNGATQYRYFDDDTVKSVTKPAATPDEKPQTTEMQYDSRGNKTLVKHPDDSTTHYRYRPTGELVRVFGARTYPAEYRYDSQGRMRVLITWEDYDNEGENGESDGDKTEWRYHSGTGTLRLKEFPDGTSVRYRHDILGRMAERISARDVVTTYRYSGAGELDQVRYSDGTPDVTLFYDRLGQKSRVIDGAGTRDYKYTGSGQLRREESPVTEGLDLEYRYDDLDRRIRLELSGAAVGFVYGYETASSRLEEVTRVDGASGEVAPAARYRYDPGSHYVASVDYPLDERGESFENSWKRDRLGRIRSATAAITGGETGRVLRSNAHTYNEANQRTRVESETTEPNNGWLSPGTHWEYGYDPLGQVESGVRYWSAEESSVAGQDFQYRFDDAGNRDSVSVGGRETSYQTLPGNRYHLRSVPRASGLAGVAGAGEKVEITLQGKTAPPDVRQGEFFYHEPEWADDSSDRFEEVTVTAGESEVSGRLFVPGNPEVFEYDDEGNLVQDGRWSYSWDAENRLTAIEEIRSAALDEKPLRRIEFLYDYQSRRVKKKVFEGTPDNWTPVDESRFVYDGWNLVAELDEDGELRKTFLWGLDIAEQGGGAGRRHRRPGTAAGGTGGLLMIGDHRDSESVSYIPHYDGSGNVLGLVDARLFTEAASYDYDPFGNLIREDDPRNLNPFRFATNYHDRETGLYYYGFRYYQPEHGRFLSRDPIGEAGGLNLYGFVDNDPVNHWDLLGLALYAFDGTWQDKDSRPVQEDWRLRTNVAILEEGYRGETHYESGVGTSFFSRHIGGAFGLGGQRRIRNAFERFEELYLNGDCEIHIIGFSRGAAMAREFANMIVDEYPEAEIQFLGLFDTVGSFAAPGTSRNPGYRLSIPDNVRMAVHATADGEKRRLYPLSSIQEDPDNPGSNPNRLEQGFPGAHANVGGGYENSDLSNGPLLWMWMKGRAQGVDFGELPPENIGIVNPRENDERGFIARLLNRDRAVYYPNEKNDN